MGWVSWVQQLPNRSCLWAGEESSSLAAQYQQSHRVEIFVGGLSRKKSLKTSFALSEYLEKEWELNALKTKAKMKGIFVCRKALQFTLY